MQLRTPRFVEPIHPFLSYKSVSFSVPCHQVYEISSNPATEPQFTPQSQSSVEAAIAAAQFTGSGDKGTVLAMYQDYRRRVNRAGRLANYSTRSLYGNAGGEAPAEPSSFFPAILDRIGRFIANFASADEGSCLLCTSRKPKSDRQEMGSPQ